MKRKSFLAAALAAVTVLACGVFTGASEAAEENSGSLYQMAQVSIPVEVVRSGTLKISSADPESPLPKQSTLNVEGKDAFVFEYDEPEHFSYEIVQEPGKEAGVTYDNTVYEVDVWIVPDEKDRLIPQVFVYKEGSSSKADTAKFVNVYPPEKSGGPSGGSAVPGGKSAGTPQTGDDNAPFVLASVMAMLSGLLFIFGRKLQKHS